MKTQEENLPVQSKNPLSVSYKASNNLQHFLQQLPDAVIVTNPDFVIRSLNHAAEEFFNLPAAHFIGSVLADAISFHFRKETNDQAIARLFADGVWNGEIVVQREGLGDSVFYANVSLLYEENGKVAAIVFVNHNITEEEQQWKLLASAESKYRMVVESLTEAVVLLDADARVITANTKAAELLAVPAAELLGQPLTIHLQTAVKEDGSSYPESELPVRKSLLHHTEENDVVMGLKRKDGSVVWISMNTSPIQANLVQVPEGIVVTFKDISKERMAAQQLLNSEMLFRSFMTHSPMLAWIYDEDGYFIYGNSLFFERTNGKSDAIGKHVTSLASEPLAQSILARNQQVLSTGAALITEDELLMPDGTVLSFLANWFPLPGTSKRLIGGHAIDITDRKKDAEQIATMHERFEYVVNASSDAIWDLDLKTGEVYRSDAFLKMSGYSKEETGSHVDWWLEKVHPDDRSRVFNKIEQQLSSLDSNWEDEYRFLHADGHYISILDRGFSIYENELPVRQVGSMTDVTSRRQLEQQLLDEQVQKQKLINKATIHAQEEERNRISGELHDNVNQLLTSAKLHIGVARKNAINQDELLDKATEYILMAVEEIRALSKRMNSKVVTKVGLLESISDIIYNMENINNLEVKTEIDLQMIQKLSEEQQLMVFRIVQEQTSNIIKHAQAKCASIKLVRQGANANLVVSDDGIGFNKEQLVLRSMGFISIFNRVDAHNGIAEIITAPGEGCSLNISFPLLPSA